MASKLDVNEILSNFLVFQQGESFLFGKGAFDDKKYVWAPVGKDEYKAGEVLETNGPNTVLKLANGEKYECETAKLEEMNPPKFGMF